MYVERKPVKDLPKGAKILTEDEVVAYYDRHIYGTTHTKNIWYLKYGFVVAGCGAFVTNMYLVDYYRRRCRIHGLFPATILNLCFVAIPSAFALFYHQIECRRRILLQDLCISCLYGRAAASQSLFSVLYGAGPSALGCLVYAAISSTYPVPGLAGFNEIKGMLEIWKKFTKRKTPALCALLALNSAGILFITQKELENKELLDETLKEQHEKLKAVAAQYQEKK